MPHRKLKFAKGFRVALANRRAQAAEMVLQPGETEGGPDNRHLGSDQWLYVVAGCGTALVGKTRHALRPGMLLLIERGEPHQISNSGRSPLQMLNFYTPPAYSKSGDPLPRGRKQD